MVLIITDRPCKIPRDRDFAPPALIQELPKPCIDHQAGPDYSLLLKSFRRPFLHADLDQVKFSTSNTGSYSNTILYNIKLVNKMLESVSCHAFCLSVDVYLPGYLAEKVVRI
jgi:hypothetical protein